jgi:hypothetical protein
MPISPIDGSYYFPETHDSASRIALAVGGGAEGRSGMGLSVTGPFSQPARMAFNVGELQEAETLMGLDVGETSDGTSRMAHTIRGFDPGVGSRMGLTVKPEPSTYASLMGLTVSSSALADAASRVGFTVRGYTPQRPHLMALTVRNITDGITGQALTIREDASIASRMGFDVGLVQETLTPMALDVVAADGFLALVDIISADFAALSEKTPTGFYPAQDITARLFVDNVQVQIRSFTYERPKGRLGASLNIALVDAIKTLAPLNSTIRFEIVVTQPGQPELVYKLVDDGKIAGRSYDIKLSGRGPGDELSIAGLDVMGDRFAIVPQSRRPIIMYDPALVRIEDVQAKVRDAVQTEKGAAILPILEPVGGLTMIQALRRAYTGLGGYGYMTRLSPRVVELMERVTGLVGGDASRSAKGLGFAAVVTNIPDYRVTRVDWGLETPWHDGVQPLVGMFGPIYFAEGNVLFIIDPFRPLPAGHTPRRVPVSAYSRMAVEQQFRDPYNAVLLTYQEWTYDNPDAWGIRDKVTQEVTQDGGFGRPRTNEPRFLTRPSKSTSSKTRRTSSTPHPFHTRRSPTV